MLPAFTIERKALRLDVAFLVHLEQQTLKVTERSGLMAFSEYGHSLLTGRISLGAAKQKRVMPMNAVRNNDFFMKNEDAC